MSQDKTDYRKNFKEKKGELPTAEASIPVPKLGEGYTFDCRAKRIDLATLIYNKSLPQSMALILLGDKKYKDLNEAVREAEADAAGMSGQDTIDVLEFMWTMAKKICVEPVLIDGTEADEKDGELALRDPSIEGSAHIIQAIYQYGMSMSRDVPVELTDGQETSVPQVERFHPFPTFPRDVRDVA